MAQRTRSAFSYSVAPSRGDEAGQPIAQRDGDVADEATSSTLAPLPTTRSTAPICAAPADTRYKLESDYPGKRADLETLGIAPPSHRRRRLIDTDAPASARSTANPAQRL
jgi:hypothetical protein